MTTRNLFNNGRMRNEQDLVESLIIESIQQRGVDFSYIKRDAIEVDYLLGEAPLSEFKDNYIIEMHIDQVSQYNGDGDMYGTFGLSKSDHMELLVSSRRFKEETDLDRPRENDLLYLSISDSLWEISKVKQDRKYYQLGKNYAYRVICNLFQYSHEEIDIVGRDEDLNDELTREDFISGVGIKNVLGINPIDGGDAIEEVANDVISFDPNNPFQMWEINVW